MSFGDRQYLEAELVPHIVGHPLAPAQVQAASIPRASYFHGQQNARMVLEQSYPFNTRDYETDRNVKRTALPTATELAGVARGRRRLRRGQTHLIAHVVYAVHSSMDIEVTHSLSVYDEDTTDGDRVEVTRTIGANTLGGSRFTSANGTFNGWNSHYASVVGAEPFPFTSGFVPMVEVIELELVDVATTGVLGLIYVAGRANQLSSGGNYDVPVHYQPLYVRVMTEARR